MKTRRILYLLVMLLISTFRDTSAQSQLQWYLPVKTDNRESWQEVQLTKIGKYGLLRKARPNIPAHLHTGSDLKRPSDNYADEPIYPLAKGKVISLRDDGPYAQIIIEHILEDSSSIWTVYEHIAGINTSLGDSVNPNTPIARFMTRQELKRHGWQFDHVHVEVMKIKPLPRKSDKKRPYLRYGTYCLVCYTKADLQKRYYDPEAFLKSRWQIEK